MSDVFLIKLILFFIWLLVYGFLVLNILWVKYIKKNGVKVSATVINVKKIGSDYEKVYNCDVEFKFNNKVITKNVNLGKRRKDETFDCIYDPKFNKIYEFEFIKKIEKENKGNKEFRRLLLIVIIIVFGILILL